MDSCLMGDDWDHSEGRAAPAVALAGSPSPMRDELRRLLIRCGCATVDLPDTSRARPDRVQLVIVPAASASSQCLETIQRIRTNDSRVPVLLVAAQSSEELAIAALRAGVTDYLRFPCSVDEVVASLRRCLPSSGVAVQAPSCGVKPGEDAPRRLLGSSDAILQVAARIPQIAASDSTVLITGETGTGKDLVAELIHRNSRRRQRAFVAVNCAAIPDNLLESELFGHARGAFTGALTSRVGEFEAAHGGTLLLDEIGEMSSFSQAKILRALEDQNICRLGSRQRVPVDVRLIAATNQSLEDLVGEAKFRKDLYFRLNVIRIHLPPLRARREDIHELCEHHRTVIARRLGRDVPALGPEALECLVRYDWPGNVRELRNVMESVLVQAPLRPISPDELPEHIRSICQREQREGDERTRIVAALALTNGNKSKAAQQLGWSRMTLYRKLSLHCLSD